MVDRLFKFGSSEDELIKSMQSSLSATKENDLLKNLTSVIDHLNAAAELLDNSGFSKESQVVVNLINKFANTQDIEKMIQESLGLKTHPINKSIEEELTKKDVEKLMSEKPSYENEYEEMLASLKDNPLRATAFDKKKSLR